MAQKSYHKKVTWEDKFDRKWLAGNKAKQIWIRDMKRANNRSFRRFLKKEDFCACSSDGRALDF